MSACNFKFNGKTLTEQELDSEYNKLQVDAKFSPVQLSDNLQKDYYDTLIETQKESQDIILDLARTKQIDVEVVFDDVKLMWYDDEVPNFKSLNGSIEEAKKALLKDREVVDAYYQISPLLNNADKALDDYLITQMKQLGVQVDIIGDLKRRFNIDSLGVADTLTKTIQIATERNIDTLPEEVAHMIVMMLGEHNSDINYLIKKSKDWSKYQSIYDQYMPVYQNETQVKLEVVAKMIAESTVEIYRKTGLNKSLLQEVYDKLSAILKTIGRLTLGELRVMDSFTYAKATSDKLAVDILSGKITTDLLKENKPPDSFVKMNFQEAFEKVPHAKNLHNLITSKTNAKLTGSLALSKQGSVYRDINEQIHDLDYVVKTEDVSQVDIIINELKSKGAVDTHFGVNNGEYYTKSILVPVDGYEIVVKERLGNKNSKWSGIIQDFSIIEKSTNKDIGKDTTKFLNLDFFMYTESAIQSDFQDVTSWEDVFKGKISLSSSNLIFGRKKDVRDYIYFNNQVENEKKFSNKFTYFQLKENSQLTEPELKTKLLSFLNTQGFEASVITEFEKHQEANGKTFTVNGFVDLMNKVVKYDESSLPEEAATVARALYVKDDSTIYEQVRQTNTYKQVKVDYKGIYKTELDFAKEALDKLLAQAIIRKDTSMDGRLLVRLKRIWDKFMSWVKGNKELNTFLDEMSSSILNGEVVGEKNSDVTGVFYQIDEVKFNSKEEELLYKGITSLKQRLKGLNEAQVGKKIGLNLREKIDLLEQDLENKEYELGLVKLLNYFNEDSKAALTYINDVRSGKYTVDAKKVKYLGEFIEYYFPVLTQLRSAINRGDIKDDGKIGIIREELSRFDDINDFYNDNRTKEAEKFLGEEIGETTNTDVNMASYLFGSLRDVNDQVLRKVHAVVSKILKNVQNVVYDLGKDLILSFNGDFNTEKFREKIDGKKTHYFLSQYKVGQFYNEYDKFITDLNAEYGITRGVPIDKKQRIEYNRKLNQWKSSNTERRFVSDYYDLFNSLSSQTVMAKESYDLAIRNILLEVTNSSNQIEFDKLSEEQFANLEQLESERKGLANLYHSDGTKKEGTDLEIALELRELYDVLKDKLESVKFSKAFKEIQAKKKKSLSPEDYKKWYDRVTSIEYDKKFYDELAALDSYNYGEEYEQLKEEKNELLKRYRNSELLINTELITPEIHKRVFDIEKRMDEIRKADKSKKPKSDFEKVASVEKTQQYYDEIKKQKAKGEAEYKKWVEENHVDGKPISIWTQLVPKNDDYVLTVPKRYWAETSEDSVWYNKNFNPEWKGMQPTDKWKNKEYDKLSQVEKDNLKRLIDLKNEGDDLYKVGSRSYYQLPQISKSTMDVFTSENKMSNLKELIEESFVDKIEDDQYGEIETRADGSQIKYIPRFYTKQLDNPDFISDDLIRTVIKYRSAAEKFKQMGNVAPELELVMDAIGDRRFVGKRKALSGKETNAYKTLKGFIDHQIYAIQQEPMGYFKLFGKDINTSKLLGKLERYVRDKNLVFNLFTTVTAYTTAAVNSKIEDLVGTYTDQKSKNFAEREYMRNVGQMLVETDKPVKTNRLSLVMEKLGFVEDPFNDLDKSHLVRLGKSLPYASYGIVSHRIKTKLALAMMSHYRIVDGKLVTQKQLNNDVKWNSLPNIYDMFEVKNNKATISKDLEDVFTELQLKIEFVANRIDGALSQTDKGAAHRHAFMQLLTTHRGWLFSGVQNRAKQKGLNEITGEYEIGYYRGWFNFLKDSFMKPNRMRLLQNMIERWNELEDYEKIAVMRTLYEIGMAVAIGVIALMLNKWADDDDDEYVQFLAYISNRTLLESSVFPSVATGLLPIASVEATSILNSPIAATNTLSSLSDIVYLFSDKELESGPYEGMTKGEKTLVNLVPGLRGAMASRSPKYANQFLKMKSLKWMPSYSK